MEPKLWRMGDLYRARLADSAGAGAGPSASVSRGLGSLALHDGAEKTGLEDLDSHEQKFHAEQGNNLRSAHERNSPKASPKSRSSAKDRVGAAARGGGGAGTGGFY